MKPYKTISKSVLFTNPWWKYCLDQIELPTGKPGEFHYVLTNGSSMIVPIDGDGKILLVRQQSCQQGQVELAPQHRGILNRRFDLLRQAIESRALTRAAGATPITPAAASWASSSGGWARR